MRVVEKESVILKLINYYLICVVVVVVVVVVVLDAFVVAFKLVTIAACGVTVVEVVEFLEQFFLCSPRFLKFKNFGQ